MSVCLFVYANERITFCLSVLQLIFFIYLTVCGTFERFCKQSCFSTICIFHFRVNTYSIHWLFQFFYKVIVRSNVKICLTKKSYCELFKSNYYELQKGSPQQTMKTRAYFFCRKIQLTKFPILNQMTSKKITFETFNQVFCLLIKLSRFSYVNLCRLLVNSVVSACACLESWNVFQLSIGFL